MKPIFKKIALLGLLCLTLPLISCAKKNEDQKAEPGIEYRKILASGTIKIAINPEKAAPSANDGGMGCMAQGEYLISMYFPMEGGTVIKQRNSMTLTGYTCADYGISHLNCTADLGESANAKQSFDLIDAKLTLGTTPSEESLQDPKVPADVLSFAYAKTTDATERQISISCAGVPEYFINNDTAFNQLYLPLTNKKLNFFFSESHNEKINEKVGSNDSFLANATWIKTQTTVPDLDK